MSFNTIAGVIAGLHKMAANHWSTPVPRSTEFEYGGKCRLSRGAETDIMGLVVGFRSACRRAVFLQLSHVHYRIHDQHFAVTGPARFIFHTHEAVAQAKAHAKANCQHPLFLPILFPYAT